MRCLPDLPEAAVTPVDAPPRHGPTVPVPRLSVVMPTRDRKRLVVEAIQALGRQTLDPAEYEVVVVCDGCADGTEAALAATWTGFPLVVLSQRGLGAAAARNAGATAARAEIILFLDDDILARPGLLEAHLREYAGGVDVAIGRLVPDTSTPIPAWAEWEFRIHGARYERIEAGSRVDGRKFYSGNVSVRREAFDRAGGFDTSFGSAEDIELGYRLESIGSRFGFAGGAVGVHRGYHEYASWRRTQYNYGRYDVRLLIHATGAQHPPLLDWFGARNPLSRQLVRVAVGRHRRRAVAETAARLVAAVARAGRVPRIELWAYSAIANLEYWQGVADEFGGAERLWTALRERRQRG
jgi:glycosyltransferase involved in cell wall biosynthesis